jgi:hypothetical protein
VVGNRWDLQFEKTITFDDDWIPSLRAQLRNHGQKHPPMGSDYFIYTKGQFADMPAFALGRAGWDNWMMYKARHSSWPLINASEAITAVHQEHDYAHLPGGQPHYRHAESMRNIELAGGLETMFRLRDADWILSGNELRQKKWGEWEWPRKMEADLIARIGTGFLARLIRMLFHPRDALLYLTQKVSARTQNEGEASL